ncbi:MAG: DUF2993 domain-containing protein [Oscillatoria sp. PMC 1051.18]|nr:DUF2993 domain-containing protein [Oscillatoria sp. PMC 1050.18]MEC5031437.1 DUF2993 domain-containing protein [Oscillatoria sp. PMC 1051.18]
MKEKQDLGEQAISTAAEVGLKSQLDEADNLEVDVRTDLGKLVQGELESVEIEGNGLVMEKDLRTEELDVDLDSIAIDPLKATFGDIELKHPTDAQVHVVLTEKDIERAFNSQYIKHKLQNLPIKVDGKKTTVNAKKVNFTIPDNQKIALSAETEIVETGETKQVAFTAVPKTTEGGNRVSLENVEYSQGKKASPELTKALLNSASELLDLRNFELEGMKLRLQKLYLQKEKLTLEAEAHVEEFPD